MELLDSSGGMVAIISFVGAILGGVFGAGGSYAAAKSILGQLRRDMDEVLDRLSDVEKERAKLLTIDQCEFHQQKCMNSVCRKLSDMMESIREDHKQSIANAGAIEGLKATIETYMKVRLEWERERDREREYVRNSG